MKQGHDKELWLFTMRFPFGTGEPFLENELPALCKAFGKVVIVPQEGRGEQRPLPPNAEVVVPFDDPFHPAGALNMLRGIGLYRALKASLLHDAPDASAIETRWPELRSRIRQYIERLQVLRKGLFRRYDPKRVMLYAYWSHDQATLLAMMRHVDPRVRFVSRMHGFDLYEDRSPGGWIPFRHFQLRHMQRVFCASQAGLDHLCAQHPADAERFELARLGTLDHGFGPMPVTTATGPLKVVSCANMVPLKRIDLLLDALQLVEMPVSWTHFGDGPEREAIERRIAGLPPHVTARLMGAQPNIAIMDWYRQHPVHLFVHLSSTEGGVPVALQEAASFGIPLLAADAGGVREVVNSTTGLLLPHDPMPRQIAQIMDRLRPSEWVGEEARLRVRAFWSENFRAEHNFARFTTRLQALHSTP